MVYSSMRNHDPSAAAISFRQVMTPGSEASQVKRSRGPGSPGETDVPDLRGTLYGLHAILRLHTMQEDEAYLSLGDLETIGGGRP